MGEGCEYDCHAGYDIWEKGWSEAKKVWCCIAEHRGCTTTTTSTTAEPTTDPHQLILAKLEELLQGQYSTSTSTQPVMTTTDTQGTCSPKNPNKVRWCQRWCNNAALTCKNMCHEKCSVGVCPCKPRTGRQLGERVGGTLLV